MAKQPKRSRHFNEEEEHQKDDDVVFVKEIIPDNFSTNRNTRTSVPLSSARKTCSSKFIRNAPPSRPIQPPSTDDTSNASSIALNSLNANPIRITRPSSTIRPLSTDSARNAPIVSSIGRKTCICNSIRSTRPIGNIHLPNTGNAHRASRNSRRTRNLNRIRTIRPISNAHPPNDDDTPNAPVASNLTRNTCNPNSIGITRPNSNIRRPSTDDNRNTSNITRKTCNTKFIKINRPTSSVRPASNNNNLNTSSITRKIRNSESIKLNRPTKSVSPPSTNNTLNASSITSKMRNINSNKINRPTSSVRPPSTNITLNASSITRMIRNYNAIKINHPTSTVRPASTNNTSTNNASSIALKSLNSDSITITRISRNIQPPSTDGTLNATITSRIDDTHNSTNGNDVIDLTENNINSYTISKMENKSSRADSKDKMKGYFKTVGDLQPTFKFPKLTARQEKLVDQALAPGPVRQILVERFNLILTRRDIRTLNKSRWLNDEIINFYMNLLMHRSEQRKELPKVYATNTFFYPKLINSGQAGLRRWTKKIDVFAYDLMVVPIHLGVHWSLSVIDFRKKIITYLDNLGDGNEECLDALFQYLRDEHQDRKGRPLNEKNWKLKYRIKRPSGETNVSDCGMFACTFAEFACRDAPYVFKSSDMPYLRRKAVYEILTCRLLL